MASPSTPVQRAVRRRDPARAAIAERAAMTGQAAHRTLAANPLIGVRHKEIARAAATLAAHFARQPHVVGSQSAKLVGELARILAGRSALAPDVGDRRFADAAWSGNAAYKRLLQSYLA